MESGAEGMPPARAALLWRPLAAAVTALPCCWASTAPAPPARATRHPCPPLLSPPPLSLLRSKKKHTERLQRQVSDLQEENAALQQLLGEMAASGEPFVCVGETAGDEVAGVSRQLMLARPLSLPAASLDAPDVFSLATALLEAGLQPAGTCLGPERPRRSRARARS